MELKPCPFCGSTRILIERGVTDDNGKKSLLMIALTIHCGNCGAMFRSRGGLDAHSKLIERWNRRPHHSHAQEPDKEKKPE